MQLLPTRPPRDDEPRVFEHAQVLHDAEARHLQLGLELGERTAVTHKEPVEQKSTGGMSERFKHTVVIGRTVVERLEHAVVVRHG